MAGQTTVIVTLDGGIHAPGTPLVHPDDLAVVRGDGIFETLLVRDGGACLVESHLQRLDPVGQVDGAACAGPARLAARDRRGREAMVCAAAQTKARCG